MYHSHFDGPLILYDDMGTYDRVRYHPCIHQRIISKLGFGLKLLYQPGKLTYNGKVNTRATAQKSPKSLDLGLF